MKSLSKQKLISVLCIFVFLLITYSVPRALVMSIGESNPWIGYLYTYIVGSVFYLSSVFFILTRRIASKRKRQVKIILIILTGLLLWGMLFHGLWIYLAIGTPFKGVI